jgi:hypothetical protein
VRPVHIEVTEIALHEHEVPLTFTDHLVSDMHVLVLHIPNRRRLNHTRQGYRSPR